MHIKHIHDMVEKLSEFAKCELDKGIEKVDTKEMGEVAEMIKELCEAEYYATCTKDMEKEAEDYDMYDDERKGYRGQRRDSRGRFMSNRGRRGYESPMMMYDEEWDEMERMRDMDRPYGRMGFSGGGSSSGMSSGGGQTSGGMSGGSQGGSRGYSDGRQSEGGNYSNRNQDSGRDSREGRSGQSRRGYMEAKEKGMDKQQKMKELEDYMKELSTDVTEMIGDASPEEKSLLKQKMQVLMQKIG